MSGVNRHPLDQDTLIRVLEGHANGPFEAMLDVEWRSLDAFARAARDYVPAEEYDDFLDCLTDPASWRRGR